MSITIQKALTFALLTIAASAQAATKAHSKSIVVDSPMDLTELAQRSSEAMFLYSTGSGQTFLYLEQDQGKSLAILDVTNPASIKDVGRSSLGASSAYDFVQSIDDSVALIRYRDRSGFAIINFKKYRQPVLTPTPELLGQAAVRLVGQGALLLTSSNDLHVSDQDRQCAVIDISDPLKPTSVVVIHGVKQQLERRETGTTFLLSQDGLTVIRRPSVEEDYQSESTQTN
jgi:hypothetical protein